MRITIPLYLLAYIKTTSKAYDSVGYRIEHAIQDALSEQYSDPVHVIHAGVLVGVVGGYTARKHLPKRATQQNALRYNVAYTPTVFCTTCNKIQRVALCHRIPRVVGGALHTDNLYVACAYCNSHTSDTIDDDVRNALAPYTLTIEL
jgi:hypothetical protein